MYKQLYLDGEPVYNGVIDTNDDGKINESDRYLTGKSPNPWLFYGLNTHFSYKNWDFSVNGHGSLGNYAINKVRNEVFSNSNLPTEQSKKKIAGDDRRASDNEDEYVEYVEEKD